MSELVTRTDEGDGIVRLTLNRPDTLNALNGALLRAVADRTREADDDGARVVIFEGAGGNFSSGADLDAEDEGRVELFQDATRAVRALDGLAVGRIEGYAIGGGFEFTLSFDLRYASEDATFRMTESQVGATVSNASTKLLPLIVGEGRAREMVFTGRDVTGTEAERIGLVARAVPPEELDGVVMDAAEDVVENTSPVALRMNKRGFNEAFPLERVLEYERMLSVENAALGEGASWGE